MSIILYILLAVLILLFMITVHELGHYISGKLLGFKINEFAIGFGPALYKKTNKTTGEVFSIRAFPLGGYCAFEGEEAGTNSECKGAFSKQAPWKRLIVLFSGAFFNFLTAIVFSFVLLVSVGYDIPKITNVSDVGLISNVRVFDEQTNTYTNTVLDKDGKPQKVTFNDKDNIVKITSIVNIDGLDQNVAVYEYNPQDGNYFKVKQLASVMSAYSNKLEDISLFDSLPNCIVTVKNADTTQKYMFGISFNSNAKILKTGDVVYKVNGKNVNVLNQLTARITEEVEAGNTQATLTIKRDGIKQNIKVDLLKSGYDGNYSHMLGVNTEPYKHTFGEALGRAIPLTFEFSWLVLKTLFQLVTGQVPMEAVGGTVTTIVVMADYAKQSLKTVLVLIPLIAANLAVFNWLPFPALDGAHMLFTGIEWIRKKPINPKVENMIHAIGLWILLGFVVFADGYQLFLRLFS